MNKEINAAVAGIKAAADKIKEISEETMGVRLSDILHLHGLGDKIVIGRIINGTVYYAADDVSAVLANEKYSDVRYKIVVRITNMQWADGYGTSPRPCFILK